MSKEFNLKYCEEKSTSFYISGLYRDTFSIYKVRRHYEGNWYLGTGSEHFSLKKPLKLDFRLFYFYIPEGVDIFESPNVCSLVVYHRVETDVHQDRKIKETFIDICDQMWIKVSFYLQDYIVDSWTSIAVGMKTTYVDGWIRLEKIEFNGYDGG